jgi:dihydropteroate synthase
MLWSEISSGRDLPIVMGIVNATPDSFSDGGDSFSPDAAIARGLRLAEEGADLIDVGGESTRPTAYGLAEPVEPAEEIRRTAPVIRELARRLPVPISIDTRKAAVAAAALDSGARVVNDVTALRYDAAMAGLVARGRAALVVMHMRGTDPRTMQADLVYEDLIGEVAGELAAAASRAQAAGVPDGAIAVDPGLGFGKNAEQSLRLLARLPRISGIGRPIVVGASRKAFVRLAGSLAAAAAAADRGAAVVRVHDVASTVALLRARGRGAEWSAAAREAGAEPEPFERMLAAVAAAN